MNNEPKNARYNSLKSKEQSSSNSDNILKLRTRDEIASRIGVGIRKMYTDIHAPEALKGKIKERGLLNAEEQRLLFAFYGIPFPFT
jgi:hypothetical protein